MQLFYNPNLNSGASEVVFDKKESGHIIRVLRKVIGDKLLITNGKGFLFEAEIINANPNKCKAEIITETYHKSDDFHLHIAVAPTKSNNRFEWFLEKATELGIDQITPIICERSERRRVKLNRFERVIESAMKQSLQYYLPKLEAPQSFSEFIKQDLPGDKFIAHCDDDENVFLHQQLIPKTQVTILIGPEGDFSPTEIQMAEKAGFKPTNLGNNRLRTETAAIAACHHVYLVNQ
ncbi:MAG TPA: 16S rRNA (uracil(1498)-N(3))-methyltransferase [Flavobacteriaceae bacterium]|nr:16S rRNA (uracil(1498)-N(3))-methyltransferase [Flavobacteriaceae bacterium]